MYVVNTTVAENGRRLVKIREFLGRVMAHGVAVEPPEMGHQSMEKMLKEKDLFVSAHGGTVKMPEKTADEIAIEQANDESDSDSEGNDGHPS
jgi:hypothetical protein